MNLPKIYKPKYNYRLLRLGKNNDGGYLVGRESVINSKFLISFGISDDWSFENDFKKLSKDTKVFTFDDSLDYKWLLINFIKNFKRQLLFEIQFENFKNSFFSLLKFSNFKKRMNFKKKYIKRGDISNITLNKDKLFFKIDIEGSEYGIFDELLSIKDKIEAIVLELHDIDIHKEKIKYFLKNIGLEVTHIHPNNFSRLDSDLNPTCIELTLEKNFQKENLLDLVLPNPLDQKCDKNSDDYELKFENE